MSNSILTTIKKAVGVAADDPSFDSELVLHINGCFPILRQLNVGPQEGFMIFSDEETWEDYLGVQKLLLQNSATMYIALKTKLNFDAPDVGFVITSMERQLEALESRFLFDTDKPPVTAEEVTTL